MQYNTIIYKKSTAAKMKISLRNPAKFAATAEKNPVSSYNAEHINTHINLWVFFFTVNTFAHT